MHDKRASIGVFDGSGTSMSVGVSDGVELNVGSGESVAVGGIGVSVGIIVSI